MTTQITHSKFLNSLSLFLSSFFQARSANNDDITLRAQDRQNCRAPALAQDTTTKCQSQHDGSCPFYTLTLPGWRSSLFDTTQILRPKRLQNMRLDQYLLFLAYCPTWCELCGILNFHLRWRDVLDNCLNS